MVDLDGFEPSTSCMPFKKNQSLTDIATENKRVSGGPFGLQWTPPSPLSRSGLRSDSRTTLQDWHRACSCARGCPGVLIVFCWRRRQIVFYIGRMPIWTAGRESKPRYRSSAQASPVPWGGINIPHFPDRRFEGRQDNFRASRAKRSRKRAAEVLRARAL